MSDAHYLGVGSVSLILRILTLDLSNSLAIEPARYDFEFTGRTLSEVSSIRLFAALMRLRFSSHICPNSESM